MQFASKVGLPAATGIKGNVRDSVEVRRLLNITFQERSHPSWLKLSNEKAKFEHDILTRSGSPVGGTGGATFVVRRHQDDCKTSSLRLFSKLCK